MGDRSDAYIVLMGKPEGKRLLGRPRRRCEINIKKDLQEGGWVGNGLDLSGSGWRQAAGTCKRGNKASVTIKCGEFLD
jgi:hypothetical protein